MLVAASERAATAASKLTLAALTATAGTVAATDEAEYPPAIRRVILPCLLAVVLLAGCGGTKTTSTTTTARRTASPPDAALCLNSDQFLVTQSGRKIRGSSPGGINFTVTFYRSIRAANAAFAHLDPTHATVIGATVVNDAGNPPLHPGGPPMTLIHDDLATLRHCIEPR